MNEFIYTTLSIGHLIQKGYILRQGQAPEIDRGSTDFIEGMRTAASADIRRQTDIIRTIGRIRDLYIRCRQMSANEDFEFRLGFRDYTIDIERCDNFMLGILIYLDHRNLLERIDGKTEYDFYAMCKDALITYDREQIFSIAGNSYKILDRRFGISDSIHRKVSCINPIYCFEEENDEYSMMMADKNLQNKLKECGDVYNSGNETWIVSNCALLSLYLHALYNERLTGTESLNSLYWIMEMQLGLKHGCLNKARLQKFNRSSAMWSLQPKIKRLLEIFPHYLSELPKEERRFHDKENTTT